MTASVPAPDCRCAPASECRDDQILGTAAPAARWLLIEQPGPWGRDALRESRLDPAVGAGLVARGAAAGVRPMLIRRPGRAVESGPRRWALADARVGSEGSRWGTFTADAELLELPFDGSAGAHSAAPIYLICAHGKHDACCAMRGRPAAAALAALRPAETWECSHVGGDRFAANLVVLPHGFYYAHATPENIGVIARAYERGEVEPLLLRGRSSVSAPVQAAQQHARVALGEHGIDALPLLAVQPLDGPAWRVRLAHPTGTVTVTVAAERSPTAGLLTCASARLERARVYRMVDLVTGGG